MIRFVFILLLSTLSLPIMASEVKELSIHLSHAFEEGSSERKIWKNFCSKFSQELMKPVHEKNKYPLFDLAKCHEDYVSSDFSNVWLLEFSRLETGVKAELLFREGSRSFYLDHMESKADAKAKNPLKKINTQKLVQKISSALPFMGRVFISEGLDKFSFYQNKKNSQAMMVFNLRVKDSRFHPVLLGIARSSKRKSERHLLSVDEFFSAGKGVYFIQRLVK